MIAFFSNLYKNNPIQLLLIIAVTYLLLKQSNVIESFKPSNVDGTIDVTAISHVSQLAQKINKALDIDTDGNVTFKQNVTNNGNVKNKRNVIVDGKVGIGTNTPATKLDVSGGWNDLITLTNPGGKSAKLITGSGGFRIDVNNSSKPALTIMHNDQSVEVGGNIKVGGKNVLKRDDQVKLGSTKAHLTNELIWHWDHDSIHAYPETHKNSHGDHHKTGYQWKLI